MKYIEDIKDAYAKLNFDYLDPHNMVLLAVFLLLLSFVSTLVFFICTFFISNSRTHVIYISWIRFMAFVLCFSLSFLVLGYMFSDDFGAILTQYVIDLTSYITY